MIQLESDEQPYIRETKVGENWMPLDRGWVAEASLLMLENKGGAPRNTKPTAEEGEEDKGRVIDVAIASKAATVNSPEELVLFSFIVPGTSIRWSPPDLAAIRVKCRQGDTRIAISLYPR